MKNELHEKTLEDWQNCDKALETDADVEAKVEKDMIRARRKAIEELPLYNIKETFYFNSMCKQSWACVRCPEIWKSEDQPMKFQTDAECTKAYIQHVNQVWTLIQFFSVFFTSRLRHGHTEHNFLGLKTVDFSDFNCNFENKN